MPLLRVIYRSSVNAGRELSLEDAVIRVGRDPTCHIGFDEVADRIVSRQHAEIRWDNTGPVLFPAPGRVILLRNRKLATPTPLAPGDILELAGPGGPSFEVQFTPSIKARAVIGSEEEVDASAATVFAMSPLAVPAPLSPPEQTVAPPVQGLAAPLPSVDEPAAHSPEPSPALAEAPAPTELAPPVARTEADPVLVQRFRRTRAVIVASFVIATTASAVGGWHAWSLQEQALAAKPKPPPKPLPPPKPAATATAPKPHEHEPVPLPDPAVRQAFAAVRRAELAVLAPTKRDAAARDAKGLHDQLVAAEQAYSMALKAQRPMPKDDQLSLIRATAKRLGECEGAMPVGFVAEVQKALDNLREDAEQRTALAEAVQRATASNYNRNLTTVLAEAGLPGELYFIPLDASGFRPNEVGEETDDGIPKGFWQLVPSAAKAFGLKVGAHSDAAAVDPDDERGHFAVETRKVVDGLRPVWLAQAAGSTLLLMTTYDHGEAALLRQTKIRAGLAADDGDPERVNLWRLYESGALNDDLRHRAVKLFTWVAASAKPSEFNLPFTPPVEAAPR